MSYDSYTAAIKRKGLRYFKGKKVLLQGLGLNQGGVAVVRTIAPLAVEFRITDLRGEGQLKKSLEDIRELVQKYKIKLILGKHREQDFKWADVVFKNPGVPYDNPYIRIAIKRSIPVLTEVGAFLLLWNKPVIGVTGTKGKSTTTALINFLLERHYKTMLGGNIGVPVLPFIARRDVYDMAVLEISSFVGENFNNLGISPNISVLTNIMVDHLNWHKTMEHYIDSKLALFKYQDNSSKGIINLDSQLFIKYIEQTNFNFSASIIGVTLNKEKGIYYAKSFGLHDVLFVQNADEDTVEFLFLKTGEKYLVKKLQTLVGKHNMLNMGLAFASVHPLLAHIDGAIHKDMLQGFRGLPGRQEFISTVNGIDFYNDTAATVQESVQVAIDRFSKEYNGRVVFIMGGVDKGADYTELAFKIKSKVVGVVLFEGSASEKLMAKLKELGVEHVYGYYGTMEQAVKKAYELALDVAIHTNNKVAVVLSPGAASFNMFLNEWDRGKQYIAAVKNLLDGSNTLN